MWRPAAKAELDCGGGGYLRVSESESESEKCEPWGMEGRVSKKYIYIYIYIFFFT